MVGGWRLHSGCGPHTSRMVHSTRRYPSLSPLVTIMVHDALTITTSASGTEAFPRACPLPHLMSMVGSILGLVRAVLSRSPLLTVGVLLVPGVQAVTTTAHGWMGEWLGTWMANTQRDSQLSFTQHPAAPSTSSHRQTTHRV